MKNAISSVVLALLVSAILSSCEKDNCVPATIVHGCPTAYIKVNDLNYYVCNVKMIDGYKDNTKVLLSYEVLHSQDDITECAKGSEHVRRLVGCLGMESFKGTIVIREMQFL